MFNTVMPQLITDLLSVGFDLCLHTKKLNYMSTQLSKLLLLLTLNEENHIYQRDTF